MEDERDDMLLGLTVEVAFLRTVVSHIFNEVIPADEVDGVIESLDIPGWPSDAVQPPDSEVSRHFLRVKDALAQALSDDRIRRRSGR